MIDQQHITNYLTLYGWTPLDFSGVQRWNHGTLGMAVDTLGAVVATAKQEARAGR